MLRSSAPAWRPGLTGLIALVPPLVFAQATGATTACASEAPRRVETEATSEQIGQFIGQRRARVLMFQGYSGAEYEDPAAMLALARQVLAAHDPKTTLVSAGATAAGIGAVYALAREAGFTTIGIVSTLARDQGVPLSDCVQQVFYVRDATWGGRLPHSQQLSPTSAAIVAHSDEMVGIGGGEIARDEMLAARRAGKPVQFHPADMNHALARDKAAKKGEAPPTDFRGAAHEALAAQR